MGFDRKIRIWQLANQDAAGPQDALEFAILSVRHSRLTCSNTLLKVTTSKLMSANGVRWLYAGISSTPRADTAFSLMSGSIAHLRIAVGRWAWTPRRLWWRRILGERVIPHGVGNLGRAGLHRGPRGGHCACLRQAM